MHRSVGPDYPEAFAVGRAIRDASVGVAVGELLAGFCEDGVAAAVDFVFPPDDAGLGEESAELRQDLRRGHKFGEEDPPCPATKTAGTPDTAVLAPVFVSTSHNLPSRSVSNAASSNGRPLPVRKAIAQGDENLATSCTTNGLGDVPAPLVAACPQAAVAAISSMLACQNGRVSGCSE